MIIIKKKIKLLIFSIIFIIVSPLIILYANGDIFTGGWSILPTGGIYVAGAPSGSSVFLDSKLQDKTSFFERNILLKNLRPDTYEILVQKDGYNSWTKKISVMNNLVSNADIFMLPTSTPLRDIPKYLLVTDKDGSTSTSPIENEEYVDTLSLFSDTLPKKLVEPLPTSTIDFKDNLGTQNSPIMNDKIGLWQENDKIFVGWFGGSDLSPQYFCDEATCTSMLSVYDSQVALTHIDFLPGYSDVILIASGNKIFAVQTEPDADKTPQIIYQGKNPDFRIDDGDLYVKDGALLYEVLL